MSWEIQQFKDVVQFPPKITLEKGELYSFLPMEDLSSGIKYVSPKIEKVWSGSGGAKFEDGDTLFARITPCLQNGKISQAKNLKNGKGFGSTEYFIFRGIENVSDSDFIYYFSLNEEFKKYAIGSMVGASGRQRANQKFVGEFEINLPPLETQKRIASILSNYDDLIENNLKRIKLLEETAQNIYKEWFVNFRFPNYEHTKFDAESGLPVGWEIDIIGNQLLTIKRNGKLKTDDYELEGKFPIIDQANGFIAGYTNNEEVVQDLHLPIVVFGDHTRRVKFVNFPFVSGADGTQLMFPKNENLLPAYFYLSINNIDLSNYAYARHYKFMKEQPMIIPDEITLNEFNKKTYPLLEQTIQLLNYNQKLKEARDILLPRLMNRTIEV
jgi:type I restriction enzyme S subunit